MRHIVLHVWIAAFLLAGCAGKEPAPSPLDARGLPGQRAQEVEPAARRDLDYSLKKD